MSIFELLPAAIGMESCESAMWPHWPVHASVMYVAFWLFHSIDRVISVFGAEPAERHTYAGQFKFSKFIATISACHFIDGYAPDSGLDDLVKLP